MADAQPPPPASSAPPQWSPDGRWWWDGSQWQPAPAPGQSPAAPAQGYAAPAQGYAAPAQGYGAPAQGYGAPAQGYGAPAQGYTAPTQGYGASAAVMPTHYGPGGSCPFCRSPWPGDAVTCKVCGQVHGLPVGVRLSSAGKRFGALLLDFVLKIVTLGIGWVIWALVINQSPGKRLLHMRVVDVKTGQIAGRGTMTVRVLGKFVNVLLYYVFLIGVVLLFMLLWTHDRQQLWDKMAGTVVVDDPNELLRPPGAPATSGAPLPPPVG